MNDFAALNEVYAKYSPQWPAPARSTVQAVALRKDALVEIVIAAVCGVAYYEPFVRLANYSLIWVYSGLPATRTGPGSETRVRFIG